jgi:mannonate dehydratase
MARRRPDPAPDRLSLDRRTLLKTVGAAALLGTIPSADASAVVPAAAQGPTYPVTFRGMPGDGPGRPRLCLGAPANPDDAQIRRLKQIGVSHVLMGGPPAPWKEEDLKTRMDRYKAGGIEIINMMIGGFNDVIWGGPKAEEQTAHVVESIKVAGKLGLPVVEYNFYAHRLTEGYKLEEGRAGAGYTAYDYTLSKDLPPREGVGTHTRAQQLERAQRFLKTIVPVAEKANVRLALHPNDPPVPLSRGSEQIMASVEQWKTYLKLVESPFNGMTFDCGVTREMGEDPVKVCRYLSERDCINHVHYRNVVVRTPYVDYTEVFLDDGQVDLFGVMRELVKHQYPRGIYPEHPRLIDMDREYGKFQNQYPGGGGFAGETYNVGYARAMLQAALTL